VPAFSFFIFNPQTESKFSWLYILDPLTFCMEHVLSFQSHVSYGYVGNRAATLPLNLLGFEVTAVHSTALSTHLGYGRQYVKGSKNSAEALEQIVEGLEAAGVFYDHQLVLSGFLPDASCVKAVGETVQKLLSESNTDQARYTIYLLDPVMGDDGQYYLPEDIRPAFQSILHLAHIITPNQFEAEELTGLKIKDVKSLQECLDKLHEQVQNIVISSINLGEKGQLTTVVSSKEDDAIYLLSYPLQSAKFNGAGDLLSALILAYYQKCQISDHSPPRLVQATFRALQTMTLVLRRTLDAARETSTEHQDSSCIISKKYELRLVQSIDSILDTRTFDHSDLRDDHITVQKIARGPTI